MITQRNSFATLKLDLAGWHLMLLENLANIYYAFVDFLYIWIQFEAHNITPSQFVLFNIFLLVIHRICDVESFYIMKRLWI